MPMKTGQKCFFFENFDVLLVKIEYLSLKILRDEAITDGSISFALIGHHEIL